MLATGTKPALLKSKLYEAKYENVWIIENLAMTIRNGIDLNQSKHEIEVGQGSSMHSKWVLSLVVVDYRQKPNSAKEKGLALHCKLLKIINNDITEFLQCRFSAYYENFFEIVRHPETAINNMKENRHFELFLEPLKVFSKHCRQKISLGAKGTEISFKLSIVSAKGPGLLLPDEEFRTKSELMCSRNLSALVDLDSQKFDLAVVCSDGKELNCHKVVLMGSSPVFKAMMEADLSESQTGVINVADISGKTMAIIIHYMYTGWLEETWSSPNIILELTYAAGKYQIEVLLKFLDNTLGLINFSNDAVDMHTICALKDLAGKLSLEKAEANLKEIIVEKIKCSGTHDDIVALFGGEKVEKD